MWTRNRMTSVVCVPASLAMAAGMCDACPPDSEGGEQRIRIIERDGETGALLELGTQLLLDETALEEASGELRVTPGMWFLDPREVAGPQVYRFRTGGVAEAQTQTRTRGNGQANAHARAILGDAKRRAGHPLSDDPAPGQRQRSMLREKSAVQSEALRRELERQILTERAAATRGQSPFAVDGEALIEGHAIIVGPDGVVHEERIGSSQPKSLPRQAFGGGRGQMQLDVEPAMAETSTGSWIGVELVEPDEAVLRYFGIAPGEAAQIGRVLDGSPAARAGLADGDIIFKVAGAPGAGPEELRDAVAASAPGKVLALNVLRKGRELDVKVRIGSRSAEAAEKSAEPAAEVAPANAVRVEERLDRLERMLEKLIERETAPQSGAPAPRRNRD